MPAVAILAWGLLTLMGTTCIGLGRARVLQGRSLGLLGHFTRHPPNLKLRTGHVTVGKPVVGVDHMTPTELEVGKGHVNPMYWK